MDHGRTCIPRLTSRSPPRAHGMMPFGLGGSRRSAWQPKVSSSGMPAWLSAHRLRRVSESIGRNDQTIGSRRLGRANLARTLDDVTPATRRLRGRAVEHTVTRQPRKIRPCQEEFSWNRSSRLRIIDRKRLHRRPARRRSGCVSALISRSLGLDLGVSQRSGEGGGRCGTVRSRMTV